MKAKEDAPCKLNSTIHNHMCVPLQRTLSYHNYLQINLLLQLTNDCEGIKEKKSFTLIKNYLLCNRIVPGIGINKSSCQKLKNSVQNQAWEKHLSPYSQNHYPEMNVISLNYLLTPRMKTVMISGRTVTVRNICFRQWNKYILIPWIHKISKLEGKK